MGDKIGGSAKMTPPLDKMTAALGCAYTFGFEFPDGTRI